MTKGFNLMTNINAIPAFSQTICRHFISIHAQFMVATLSYHLLFSIIIVLINVSLWVFYPLNDT